MVSPLTPMFHTEAYNLPLRILKEQAVIRLSGLCGFWTNISLSDAELIPETLLRNVCGNCFHPDLVGSALGSDTILRAWAKGEVEGPTPQQTFALKEVGMQRVFAALRAPVHVNFQFKDYIAKLLGADPGKLQQLSSSREAQCPDLTVVEELHNSFKQWEKQPGVCSLMAVCIAATACKAGTSWPLGHVLLLPNGEEVYACHVGAEAPKLLFLVDCKQLQYPLVTAVAATAYNTGIQLGTLPRWGRSCWKIRGGLNDPDFVFEQRDGQWIVNIGTWHTQMQGCPMCLLGKVLGGMPMA